MEAKVIDLGVCPYVVLHDEPETIQKAAEWAQKEAEEALLDTEAER